MQANSEANCGAIFKRREPFAGRRPRRRVLIWLLGLTIFALAGADTLLAAGHGGVRVERSVLGREALLAEATSLLCGGERVITFEGEAGAGRVFDGLRHETRRAHGEGQRDLAVLVVASGRRPTKWCRIPLPLSIHISLVMWSMSCRRLCSLSHAFPNTRSYLALCNPPKTVNSISRL